MASGFDLGCGIPGRTPGHPDHFAGLVDLSGAGELGNLESKPTPSRAKFPLTSDPGLALTPCAGLVRFNHARQTVCGTADIYEMMVYGSASMSIILDLRNESLIYMGLFKRPPFELWGGGGGVVRELYEALQPYNVTLQQIQVAPSLATAGDTILTIRIGQTVLTFSYEKIEVLFTAFSEAEFQGIPKFLQAATEWLTKDTSSQRFKSHEVRYFSHSVLKDAHVDEFLLKVNSKAITSEGINVGGGLIFNHVLPRKQWIVSLTMDRSQFIKGALFIGLSIHVESPTIDYQSLLIEGREFFMKAVGQFGLVLPDEIATEK